MPLEPDFDFIDDLVPANPDDDDLVLEGAAHLRGIKQAVQGNVTGDDAETRLNVDGLPAMVVRRPGIDGPLAALRNTANDDDLALLIYDPATDTVRLVSFTGPAALAFAGFEALATTQFGAALFSEGIVSASLTLANDDGEIMVVRANPGSPSQIEALRDSLGIQLRAFDAGSVSRVVFNGDPDGPATMYFGGAEAIQSRAVGGTFLGSLAGNPAAGDAMDTTIQLSSADGNLAGQLQFAAGVLNLDSRVLGSILTLRALGGAGQVNVFQGDPNGQSRMYAEGVAKINATPVGATIEGQVTVVSAAPTAVNHATRKDYVDGRSQGNVAQRQIVVNGVMLLAGITTAVGQSVSVTYATPFSGATPVVSLTVNAAAGNNAFAFITNSTLTGFTATAGLSGAGVHWMAQGAL